MHAVSGSLGLSIGAANLVAACPGSTPVARRSVLTLFDDRPSEIGLPDQPNARGTGLTLRGFVERVGNPEPLVAANGTRYPGEALTVEALDAMGRTVGYGAPITIAVPAYWSKRQVAALREALFAHSHLTPAGGLPPMLVSDATTALAALCAEPGFPTDGVVALCDFGASGTSVTLSDAASNFRQIGSTVRYTDFSGDRVDQLILSTLQARAAGAATDHISTRPMGSLSRRLDQCRRAKEQLSTATVTVIPAEMPNFGRDLRLSRAEFEQMIFAPLERFITAVERTLQRNGVARARLAAAATIGGGACIPLITTRLSERLEVPIFATPQPAFSAAIGASELGRQRASSSAPTAIVPPVNIGPDMAGGQPTAISPAGWATQAAPHEVAGESAVDNDHPATYRAPLAWSEETGTEEDAEPIPYVGDDDVEPEGPPVEPRSRRRHSRPALLMGVSGAAAVVLVGVGVAVAYKFTSSDGPIRTPAPLTSPVASTAVEQQSQPPSATSRERTSTASVAAPPSTTATTAEPNTTWATPRPSATTTPPTTPGNTTTGPNTTAATTGAYPWESAPWSPTTTPQGPAAPVTPTTAAPRWGY